MVAKNDPPRGILTDAKRIRKTAQAETKRTSPGEKKNVRI